jgi:hypothetical protein
MQYLVIIMRIPKKLSDKSVTKNQSLKTGLLDVLKYSLKILNKMNQNFGTFPEEKREELELRLEELNILKEKLSSSKEKKNHRTSHGNNHNFSEALQQLKGNVNFTKRKSISDIQDYKDLVSLIQSEEVIVNELLEEQQRFNKTMEIVRNIIIDLHTSSIFIFLSEELKQEDILEEILLSIIEDYINLIEIPLVLEAYIIRYEREVVQIIGFISADRNEEILKKIFYFLWKFYMNSYELDIFSNFKLNTKMNYTETEEKIFEVFTVSKNDEIKLLISLLFVTLSLLSEIWHQLSVLQITKPTSRFITKFILNSSKDEDTFEKNMEKINWIVKLYSFICQDKNFKRINHVEFFENNLNVVIVLFRICHPSFKRECILMLNRFTQFVNCKEKILLKASDNTIIKEIQYRVGKNCKEFITLIELNKDSHNKLKKLSKDIYNGDEIEKYRKKFLDDIKWYDKMVKESKSSFINRLNVLEEFCFLIGILNNLLLTDIWRNDFSEIVKKVLVPYEEYDSINFEKRHFGNLYKLIIRCDDLLKNFTFMERILQSEGIIEGFEDDQREKKLIKKFDELARYMYQFTILRMLVEPLHPIKGYYYTMSVAKTTTSDFHYYLEMIDLYINDHEILHKLLFSFNLFLKVCDKNEVFFDNNIKNELRMLINKLINLVFTDVSTVILNREACKLLCSLSMFSDQTTLWLRMENERAYIDYSNYSDVMVKYPTALKEFEEGFMKRIFKNPNSALTKKAKDLEKGLIIYTPYKRVDSYENKLGTIFYSNQALIIPNTLYLGENFTICFRFYNPVINTGKFHTLLADEYGSTFIGVTQDRTRLGLFTQNGEWVDSGIDLEDLEFENEWLQVVITFTSGESSTSQDEPSENQICFYLESNLIGEPLVGKQYNLPQTVRYIGNTKNFEEPFGIFCDLRIYNNFYEESSVQDLYPTQSKFVISYFFPKKILNILITNFLTSLDNTEESFYYTIKLFNNLLAEAPYRKNKSKVFFKVVENNDMNFNNHAIISKVVNWFTYRGGGFGEGFDGSLPNVSETNKLEMKKEISKFLKNIN